MQLYGIFYKREVNIMDCDKLSLEIGLRIKQRRKELGISAMDIAKKIGKNKTTVYRYESGDISTMPVDILKPLSEILQTTPAYLLGWEISNSELLDCVNKYILTTSEQREVISFIDYLMSKKEK